MNRALLLFVLCFGLNTHSLEVGYITDIEGSEVRWRNFVRESGHFELFEGQPARLKPGHIVIYGGDIPDRFLGQRAVTRDILSLVLRYPGRFIVIPGNRDNNKLRIPSELTLAAMNRPPTWYSFVNEHAWRKEAGRSHSPVERLQFILKNTMGAPNAFELYREELARERAVSKEMISDGAVLHAYLDDLHPRGPFGFLLGKMRPLYRVGNTLVVHGGVTLQSVGRLPNGELIADLNQWILHMQRWYEGQYREWVEGWGRWSGVGRRPGEDLIEYSMPSPLQSHKQESVVYGRNVLDLNNPAFPVEAVIRYLKKNGIRRLLVGHTPTGESSVILRELSDQFEIISADNSYSNEEFATVVRIYGSRLQHTEVRGQVRLNGQVTPIRSYLTLGQSTAIGKRLSDGSRVIGRTLAGDYVSFRFAEGFKVINKLIPAGQISDHLARDQEPLPLHSDSEFIEGPIGFYPGSFDPVAGHREIILEILKKLPIQKLFVVVNIRGPKDYEAGVVERMDMLKVALKGLEDRVEIRGEPFGGRELLFQSLRQRTRHPIYSFVGEDSYPTIPEHIRRQTDRIWVLIPRPDQNVRVRDEDLLAPAIKLEVPQALGSSSTRLRDDLHRGDGAQQISVDLAEWIDRHRLYRVPTSDEARQMEIEFKRLFHQFYDDLKAHMGRMDLKPLEPPPFRANQSRGGWFEKFLIWVIEQNQLQPADAGLLADSARVIFSAPEWESSFPTAKIKGGMPSSRCLRYLKGQID